MKSHADQLAASSRAHVHRALTRGYPLKLWLAYGAFGLALPAQYVLYWLIGAARSSWLIEARAVSVLHEAVFYGAPLIVGSATLMLWFAAKDESGCATRSCGRARRSTARR